MEGTRKAKLPLDQRWYELCFLAWGSGICEPRQLEELWRRYLLSDTRGSTTPLVLPLEYTSFGRVQVVYETPAVGVYRLIIEPGKSIPPHIHELMDERELVITEGLEVQGRPVKSGSCHHWPRRFIHTYHNPTIQEQVVVCIDQPSFIPDDERVVTNSSALSWPPAHRSADLFGTRVSRS